MFKSTHVLHSVKALALLSSFIATAALAETNTTTVTTTESSASRLLKQLSVTYFGIYDGFALSGANGLRPGDEYAKTSKAQRLRNYFNAGYKIDQNLVAGLGFDIYYQPVRGQDLTLRDPYLRVNNRKFISSGKFNVAADFRVYLPASRAAHMGHMLAGFRSTQITTYDIPNSRFTVGAFSLVRRNVFNGTALNNDAATQSEAYIGPNVTYKISPKVSLNLLYELAANQHQGQDIFDWNNDGTDLQPGVSWDVTPNLNINPYLNFYTGGKVNADTTSVGMYISATLL